MNPIAHQPFGTPFHQNNHAGGTSFQSEHTRLVLRSESQQAAISLTTAEGDRVTLSLSETAETMTGAYDDHVYGPDRFAAPQAAFIAHSGSQLATIEIEGDLNDAEWAEIEAAVGVIDGMMDDFRKGDFAAMAQEAELLRELDTISTLDSLFSVERQILTAQTDRLSGRGMGGGGGRPGPPGIRGLMRRMDRLTDQMLEVVRDFGGHQDALLHSIDERLERFREHAPPREGALDLALSAMETVRAVFFEKVQAQLGLQRQASNDGTDTG
jgi:hypothetical protein